MRILIILILPFYLVAFCCEAKKVEPGFSYKTYQTADSTDIKVITLDPKRYKIVAVRAHEVGQEMATIGVMAHHFNAIAAINGGFFRLNKDSKNWVPAGILKINNQWHGIAYQNRGAIGWNPNTGVILFDRLQTTSNLIIANKVMPINAMNKITTDNKMALLSDSFAEPVQLTNGVGITILDRKIQTINNNTSVIIPPDGYLYYVGGNKAHVLKNLKIGDVAIINITVQPLLNKDSIKQWNKMPYIVGGGPLLIFNSKKIKNFKEEQIDASFIFEKNARTAVGLLRNGNIIFVVAEGGVIQNTTGLTIPQLQDFMVSLGCIAALNLDGGFSSAMYLRDTMIPTIERPVADAILVLEKN